MHVTLQSPCFTEGMESSDRRKGFETLGNAAARLLAKMAQRAEKASGGCKQPEQIQSGRSKAGAGEDGMGGALDPRQHSAVRGGGTELNAANDDGRPVCSAVSFQWGRHGDHGLPDRDESTTTDRATRHAPGD